MEHGPAALNPLEKEGAIRRFEYCFELAWKTVKDYMEQSGFVFPIVTPRQVLKDAFAARIIADGQVWIDMLDHRNLLSHTYSQKRSRPFTPITSRALMPSTNSSKPRA
jgi:nucleotidyltransferase substrate binding protein (TIGR01987 family)